MTEVIFESLQEVKIKNTDEYVVNWNRSAV